MTAPIVTMVIASIVFLVFLALGEKVKDEIRTVALVVSFVVFLVGIKWIVDINTRRNKIIGENNACLLRMVHITRAVEKYNKNRVSLMEDLDVNKLIENKYLKAEEINKGCEYSNDGDLAAGGTVVCKKHGSGKDILERLNKI